MKQSPNKIAETYRLRVSGDSWAVGTNNGAFQIPSPEGPYRISVIVSCGGGWDHVSVSLPNRCPTWREMVAAKNLFFRDDEIAMELHPAKADYVNCHPFTLHLWRPQTAEERAELVAVFGEEMPESPTCHSIPLPPAVMVGPKAMVC